MVDLKGQYLNIKDEVDAAIQDVINTTSFINGPKVKAFQEQLENYLGVNHVIPCANGTDALQIALMSLDLVPGDEVIVPCFTYVATAEVIALLQLKPVLIDVDFDTFNINAADVEKAITDKTKVIVAVHLFGQCTNMDPIMELAGKHNLFVIEDTAQAIGSVYTSRNGEKMRAGTIGHIGCTSFFPSKNLGCYGDGGALYTNNKELSDKIRKIANHGQSKKYHHELVGVNSRLDTLQAAILSVKLKNLDTYEANRNAAASHYDNKLKHLKWLQVPHREPKSTHVFHQYTIKLTLPVRDLLKSYLAEKGIPSMVYYPVPLNKQEAFKESIPAGLDFPVTEKLCAHVLSLPIHTEMTTDELNYITQAIIDFDVNYGK